MKSGVSTIWRPSEVLDQIAGTRTLPSPRRTLSNIAAGEGDRGAAEDDAREAGRAASRTSPLAAHRAEEARGRRPA